MGVSATLLVVACGGSGNSSAPVGVVKSDAARDVAPVVPADDATELANDDRGFAINLYQQLRAQPGNLVFSPTSISLAAAMLYNGAATTTATEIAAALEFTLPIDRLNAAFDALDLALVTPPAGATDGTFQLSVANSIWLQQGFAVLPSYLDPLATSYGAGVNTVDFAQHLEAARAAINASVAQQTMNQIPTLFAEGTLDPSVELALTNAVYFHGDWLSPFEPSSPNGVFHAAGGDVSVPMMANSDPNATLWSGTGWNAAALAYAGGTTQMILVVPDAGTFDAFEQALTAGELAGILGPTQPASGFVTMPKFEFMTAEKLNAPLAALGMPDAFQPTADFSGIDGAHDLEVGVVVHQATIAVDEKGTTAAAATGISVRSSAVILAPSLVVDRPFLFFIVHQPTNAILFAGRVLDPTM